MEFRNGVCCCYFPTFANEDAFLETLVVGTLTEMCGYTSAPFSNR